MSGTERNHSRSTRIEVQLSLLAADYRNISFGFNATANGRRARLTTPHDLQLQAPSEEKCRLKDGLHIPIRKVSCAAGILESVQVDRAGGHGCMNRLSWSSRCKSTVVMYKVIEEPSTSYTKEYVPRARRRQLICGKELSGPRLSSSFAPGLGRYSA